MGRGATLEAERSLVQVGVVRTRAVVTMDSLEKDSKNVFLKGFFFFSTSRSMWSVVVVLGFT